jgi:hypothetical protein
MDGFSANSRFPNYLRLKLRLEFWYEKQSLYGPELFSRAVVKVWTEGRLIARKDPIGLEIVKSVNEVLRCIKRFVFEVEW